ncbi:MAG: HD domain-containing protein [Firmicutes bacterium]|nr:HD domain-containing protein [Bacillota bacterium]
MKFIAELKDNDHVLGHYLCKFKQSLKTRAGKTYYSLKLQDKTGVIDAKVWELTKDIQDFNEGDMIKIDATALLYQGEMQIKIHKLRRSLEGEYVISDYIPTTERNVDEMYGKLVKLVNSVENLYIKTLLENILIKNEDRAAALKTHSAAKAMHHSYMGGLLEHILSVAEICEFMCSRYKYINRDLLLAGALLHDIGKIYELSPMPINEYTDDGQMLGHIIIGVEMAAVETMKIEGFPHQLASLIKHLIISHHGEFEFGSPKLPCTAEAILLHYADNMDAKLKTFEEFIDKDATQGPWVGYQKALARHIRKSDF